MNLAIYPDVACPTDATPGSPATVRWVYLSLLGRCPDLGGLNNGAGRWTVAAAYQQELQQVPVAVTRGSLTLLRHYGYNGNMEHAIVANRSVGIRELRDRLSRHLDAVRAGGEITVTDHGKPVARIVPVGDDAYTRLLKSGRLTPAENADAELPARRRAGMVSDLIER